MNIKEEFVNKIIEDTIKNKMIWNTTIIENYKEYLLDSKKVLRLFLTKLEKSQILIAEKKYIPEENQYMNNYNDFEELLYEIYVVEGESLKIVIQNREIARELYKKMINCVVSNFTEKYLENLLKKEVIIKKKKDGPSNKLL